MRAAPWDALVLWFVNAFAWDINDTGGRRHDRGLHTYRNTPRVNGHGAKRLELQAFCNRGF